MEAAGGTAPGAGQRRRPGSALGRRPPGWGQRRLAIGSGTPSPPETPRPSWGGTTNCTFDFWEWRGKETGGGGSLRARKQRLSNHHLLHLSLHASKGSSVWHYSFLHLPLSAFHMKTQEAGSLRSSKCCAEKARASFKTCFARNFTEQIWQLQ